MKFTKIEAGKYESENGYIIKKHMPMNGFTGKPMSSRETRWHIFKDGNKIDWALTLKEAKEIVENL